MTRWKSEVPICVYMFVCVCMCVCVCVCVCQLFYNRCKCFCSEPEFISYFSLDIRHMKEVCDLYHIMIRKFFLCLSKHHSMKMCRFLK
jgi:hypothetical protein